MGYAFFCIQENFYIIQNSTFSLEIHIAIIVVSFHKAHDKQITVKCPLEHCDQGALATWKALKKTN